LARIAVSKADTYLTAGFKLLPLGIDAFVVIHVVLPAVLGLVLVREASVETYASHTALVSFPFVEE